MAETKTTWIGKHRRITALLIGLLELIYIVAIASVLIVNHNDCDYSLRLWLIILLVIYCTHLILLVLADIFTPYCSNYTTGLLSIFAASINALIGTFMMIWFILGNFWYYNVNEDCETDFAEGYALTFVILVIYYCFLVSACICGCVMIYRVCASKDIHAA